MDDYLHIQQNLLAVLASREDNKPYTYSEIQDHLQFCYKALQELRALVLEQGFKNSTSECKFFKEIKPKVFGNLIFYSKLLELEIQRPKHSKKAINKFVAVNIATLQEVFPEHRKFHQYMLCKRVDRDMEYFCRPTRSIKISHFTLAYCSDPLFSTKCDYIAALFYAHTLLIDYLLEVYKKIKRDASLKWTGSKVDLVELIYALYAAGQINNGNVPISQLASVFVQLFNIELGDYYRTFQEIRMRKTSQTKLLDFLKISLINKISETDN